MFVSCQNSYVEILTPNEMTLGGGASGRCLGHEGGALVNGIDALIRDPRELPCPFCQVRTWQEVCDPEEDQESRQPGVPFPPLCFHRLLT